MSAATVDASAEACQPRHLDALADACWKHARHANEEPKKTPPLFSRSRLHLLQVTSGERSQRLPGKFVVTVMRRYRRDRRLLKAIRSHKVEFRHPPFRDGYVTGIRRRWPPARTAATRLTRRAHPVDDGCESCDRHFRRASGHRKALAGMRRNCRIRSERRPRRDWCASR